MGHFLGLHEKNVYSVSARLTVCDVTEAPFWSESIQSGTVKTNQTIILEKLKKKSIYGNEIIVPKMSGTVIYIICHS